MNDTALVIITALCSGLVATVFTIWWQKKSQKAEEKTRIFTTLMAKRYDVTAPECVEALNMIDVVFYHSPKVREAWKGFRDATDLPDSESKGQIITDKRLRLLEVIAEDIGYTNIRWEDIKHYYYPMGLSDKMKDEAILRRVQIDAAIAQIKQVQKSEGAAQVAPQTDFNNQMLLKALENPEGMIKLFELAEKAQGLNKGNKNRR